MIAVGDKLVSDEVFEKKFVCDLSACKGACCVEGAYGAPLAKEELETMKDLQEKVAPYLSEEGRKSLRKQGAYVVDPDGDHVTPLIDGKECAYTTFDKNGIAKCGIEEAYNDGAVNFRKPISCHLYPIRVTKLKDFDALNFHHWPICAPACECGEKLEVPTFKFLKAPLIRSYGEGWYTDLEKTYTVWQSQK
jgi:hypothetical protein